MNQHSEYSQVARDPERRDRLIRALPLLVAAIVSLPLVWLSLRFSLMVGQIAYYVVLMGTSALNILGLGIMTLLGVAGLIGAIVCIWRGFKRRTWKWRIGWALGAIACAGALPLSWVLLGYTSGPPL